jgi:DNA polymerase III sliding clamp (beta) subunit (PCNA family)
MTEITFENAQLADALGKANRLAPYKGAAFDAAAGFLMAVNPTTLRMTIRATDLDCTYLQHVPAVSGKGDEVDWRLPSQLLAGMVQSLPMGQGATVKLIDKGDSFIRLTSGKWVAKLHQLRAEDYPKIPEFDTMDMTEANDFAAKVDQVAWACDLKSNVLCGVHMDGDRLIGCSQHGMAVVPCGVTIEDPVTVPLTSLATILKNATDVRLRAVEKQFQMSLDAETQATARLVPGTYPDVDRIMRDDQLGWVTVHKQNFLDAMQRMLVLVRQERMPAMRITFDCTGLVNMLTFGMEVESVGQMQDSIDVTSDFDGQWATHVMPSMIVNAVSHSRADTVTIGFASTDESLSNKVPLVVKDDRGYACYISQIVR